MKVLFAWLLLCLAPLVAVAQANPPVRPMFIDSKEECATVRGAWVQRGSWQRACQTSWARDECLPLGGEWTAMVGAPSGGVCMARVSDFATARQCTESGGNWGPSGSKMPFCQAGTPRTAAVALRKAPDAGKKCDSQRDCTYGCVYQGPPKAEGADVLGQCRADNARSGCFTMVEKGRLSGRICLD
ncbi:MAG: hypothetical protein HY854_13765 [Burkholderiales bacterium]|nr:hypothetical protein [Burkholderiales bacterium]